MQNQRLCFSHPENKTICFSYTQQANQHSQEGRGSHKNPKTSKKVPLNTCASCVKASRAKSFKRKQIEPASRHQDAKSRSRQPQEDCRFQADADRQQQLLQNTSDAFQSLHSDGETDQRHNQNFSAAH